MMCNVINYLPAVTKWCHKWQLNGWKVTDGSPVQNKEEIMKILELCKQINIVWVSCLLLLLLLF